MYNDKIIEVFNNPSCVGILQGHNAQGTTNNEISNEIIRIYLLIEDEVVKEAKFKAFGGVECIAYTSVACQLIEGQNIQNLEQLSVADFFKKFGEPSENAKLIVQQIKQTLELALKDYYKRLEKESK